MTPTWPRLAAVAGGALILWLALVVGLCRGPPLRCRLGLPGARRGLADPCVRRRRRAHEPGRADEATRTRTRRRRARARLPAARDRRHIDGVRLDALADTARLGGGTAAVRQPAAERARPPGRHRRRVARCRRVDRRPPRHRTRAPRRQRQQRPPSPPALVPDRVHVPQRAADARHLARGYRSLRRRRRRPLDQLHDREPSGQHPRSAGEARRRLARHPRRCARLLFPPLRVRAQPLRLLADRGRETGGVRSAARDAARPPRRADTLARRADRCSAPRASQRLALAAGPARMGGRRLPGRRRLDRGDARGRPQLPARPPSSSSHSPPSPTG